MVTGINRLPPCFSLIHHGNMKIRCCINRMMIKKISYYRWTPLLRAAFSMTAVRPLALIINWTSSELLKPDEDLHFGR